MECQGYPSSMAAPLGYLVEHIVRALASCRVRDLLLITQEPVNRGVDEAYRVASSIAGAMGAHSSLYTVDPKNPLAVIDLALLMEEHSPTTLLLGGGPKILNITLYTAATLVRSSIATVLVYSTVDRRITEIPGWILSLSSSHESRARLRILKTLAEMGRARPRELAEKTGYAKSTITKHLRWLQRAGLVDVKLGLVHPTIEATTLRKIRETPPP